MFTVSSTVISAQIHNGTEGSVGSPIIYSFTSTASSQRQVFRIEDIVTRTFNPLAGEGEPVFQISTYAADQQVQDFLNGMWFIDVYTTAFPAGELRGQLLHQHRMYARLDSDGIITNTGFSSRASGLFLGTYAQTQPMRRLVTATMVHNVVCFSLERTNESMSNCVRRENSPTHSHVPRCRLEPPEPLYRTSRLSSTTR